MKPGRPRKPEADRRTEVIHVRATKDEADAAYRLAQRHACTLTELLHAYLRHVLDAEILARVPVVQKLVPRPNARILAGVVIH